MRPHVKVGCRYRMEAGEIEVESILTMSIQDIAPELARASGFKGVVDLLRIAKHGKGENVYLVRFHYVPPSSGLRHQAFLADHTLGEAVAGCGRGTRSRHVLPNTG